MCRSWTSYRWQPRQDGSAEAELHILRRFGRAEVWNGFHITSLVVRANGSAGAELQIFGNPITLEMWKQNFTSLTGPYPTDCHCHCWRIALLTAISVIPNEGQYDDQVWLKQGLSQCSWQGHYAPAGTLDNIDLGPILGPSNRVQNSPSDWRVDPVGSLVPVAFGHDVCLMSGSLSYVSWFVTAW